MTETLTLDKATTSDPAAGNRATVKGRRELQVLGFKLAERDFGLDTENVVEIVRQVEVTEIPEAPEYVEGIINIRETVVPLVNLQRLLRIGNCGYHVNSQIIVVYSANGIVGLLVDGVSDIKAVPRTSVMSPGRSTAPLTDFMLGVVDLQGALAPLLDVKKLVDHERWGSVVARAVLPGGESASGTTLSEQDKLVLRQRALELRKKNTEESFKKKRLITFALGDEWYGIDIANVKEISKVIDIYFIPSAPNHIAGTINLRGAIVPVIDLSRFLGLSNLPAATDTSIVVVEHNQVIMGLLADQVGDIVDVPLSSIEPPLTTIEKSKAACLEGGVELNGNLLGILRLEQIIQLTGTP
jgi:purine-binding chemotaxis protein CheW